MIQTLAYHANDAVTATETSLTKINDDRIKSGSNPVLQALIGICTDDLTNIKVTSPDLPTMGLIMAGGAKNWQKMKGKLTPGSKMSVTGEQASGGNLDIGAIIMYSIGARRRAPENGKPCGQVITPTGGADAIGTFVDGTNFRADKHYAILSVRTIAATLQEFAILRHADWEGDIYVPAQGITGTYAGRDMNEFPFPEDDIPIFSGATPIAAALYGAASAGGVYLDMIEF